MNYEDYPDVWEIVYEAGYMPPGPASIARMEEGVALADGYGNVELSFEVRMFAMRVVGHDCQKADKMLTMIAWLLATYDANKVLLDDKLSDLLWMYKWLAATLWRIPSVSRQQIEATFKDMERRYLEAGYGLRPIYDLRCTAAMNMGDHDVAREWFSKWLQESKDMMDDCAACLVDSEVTFHFKMGEIETGLEKAAPLLARKLRCSHVPNVTYADVLLPLVQLGRVEEAMRYHRTGYKAIKSNEHYLASIGKHISFLALTGNHGRAVSLFENHAPWLERAGDLHQRVFFLRAAVFLFRRIAETGREEVTLRLPDYFKFVLPDRRYQLDSLVANLESMLHEIEARFDRRNGNNYYSSQSAALEQMKEFSVDYPFTTRVKTA